MKPRNVLKNYPLLTLLTVGALMTSCANYPYTPDDTLSRIESSPQFSEGKFRNKAETRIFSIKNAWAGLKEVAFNNHPRTVPKQAIPTIEVEHQQFLKEGEEVKFARLGHSTLLIRLGNKNWLTDPVFSERVSPVQWMGPKRFHDVPMDLNDLPNIEGVVISHSHYDHLDHASIMRLKDSVNHFIVPLGIGDILRNWGVDDQKIVELDWWEKVQIDDVDIVSTPAQHFSGRSLTDSDETLWSSWVIKNAHSSIYFSGDTGYFDGFKDIGERYGPFDYAFMECGAYNQQWRDIHMMPEDTLQAFLDVQGKVLVPVHNGTFDLSNHAWYDPFEQIHQLAQEHDVKLLTPVIGDVVNSNQAPEMFSRLWWQTLQSPQLELAGE